MRITFSFMPVNCRDYYNFFRFDQRFNQRYGYHFQNLFHIPTLEFSISSTNLELDLQINES